MGSGELRRQHKRGTHHDGVRNRAYATCACKHRGLYTTIAALVCPQGSVCAACGAQVREMTSSKARAMVQSDLDANALLIDRQCVCD